MLLCNYYIVHGKITLNFKKIYFFKHTKVNEIEMILFWHSYKCSDPLVLNSSMTKSVMKMYSQLQDYVIQKGSPNPVISNLIQIPLRESDLRNTSLIVYEITNAPDMREKWFSIVA